MCCREGGGEEVGVPDIPCASAPGSVCGVRWFRARSVHVSVPVPCTFPCPFRARSVPPSLHAPRNPITNINGSTFIIGPRHKMPFGTGFCWFVLRKKGVWGGGFLGRYAEEKESGE